MARPKTVHIDQDAILAAIIRFYREDLAAAQAKQQEAEATYAASETGERYSNWQAVNSARRQVGFIERWGIPYHIPRFLGREPTPTERLRVQAAIRSLEETGCVVRDGKEIRPCLENLQ